MPCPLNEDVHGRWDVREVKNDSTVGGADKSNVTIAMNTQFEQLKASRAASQLLVGSFCLILLGVPSSVVMLVSDRRLGDLSGG